MEPVLTPFVFQDPSLMPSSTEPVEAVVAAKAASEPEVDARPLLRSFGRRRGRVLSPRQRRLLDEALPRLAVKADGPVPEPAKLFGRPVANVWLEIGFGGGEHLIWQAERNCDIGLIGAEPFEDGVVKVLTAIEERGIENIRLYADDARALLRRLPNGSIGRVFVLFPDPWPKKRQAKRRLLSVATIELLARVMRPGAELRIGTDIADYARTILLAIAREGSFQWRASGPRDWRVRPADWPATRYEQKAHREGRTCSYLSFERR